MFNKVKNMFFNFDFERQIFFVPPKKSLYYKIVIFQKYDRLWNGDRNER